MKTNNLRAEWPLTEAQGGIEWHPYKVLSLLMLLKFSAARFLTACVLITRIERVLHDASPEEKGQLVKAIKEFDKVKGYLVELKDICKILELRSSYRQLQRILGSFDEITSEQCQRHFADLELRVNDDLEEALVFRIPASIGSYYEDALKLYGEGVIKCFPKSSDDIEEASKCLALGRSTACVYHCMRIAEYGLRRVAKAFGIPFSRVVDSSWGPIIDEIEAKIRELEKQPKKSSQLKRKLQLYAEAAVQMRHFKLAWRNSVSHTKASYTQEKAREIFDAVRSFMHYLTPKSRKAGKPQDFNVALKKLFALGGSKPLSLTDFTKEPTDSNASQGTPQLPTKEAP